MGYPLRKPAYGRVFYKELHFDCVFRDAGNQNSHSAQLMSCGELKASMPQKFANKKR